MSGQALETAGRFVIERRLGQGGFGTVFQALDRKRDQRVALKMLHRVDPAALLRFKQEFRSLADVRHRNLVRLGELVSQGEEWMFTMELVDGVDVLAWVRSGSAPPPDPASAAYPIGVTMPAAVTLTGEEAGAVPPGRFDEERLRDAFAQLAEAVSALHELGLLHRDLKPSNVLMSREGRLVVLDFGLVANLTSDDVYESANVVGTPAYMSPEQSAGRTVSPASDWYSVGVMLFEALTGTLPFRGSSYQVLVERQSADAPRPLQLSGDVPTDLDALCTALLSRDPAARPSGEEVARRLRRGAPAPAAPAARTDSPFVGRSQQIGVLRAALDEVRSGHAVTVHVTGNSGMGKTALARRFLDDACAADRDALVLAGRCYERESVPYKALDGVVDALSRHLSRVAPVEAARVLPRDWHALTRLFPVLGAIGAAASVRRARVEVPEPQELRRRAFAALRELFGRLADQRLVAVFIDDLQWGDQDSGVLLRELMRPPEAPALLLLLAYRAEDAARSPILGALASGEGAARRDVAVGSLTPAEARDLALALLKDEGAEARAAAERIAAESGGSPFFVDELAHPGTAAAEGGVTTAGTLDASIRTRASALGDVSLRFLATIAVAGRPVDIEVAAAASSLDSSADTVDELLGGRWIRRCAVEGREAYETFHDRIREAVTAMLPADELAACHRRLAHAWEAAPTADAETLAEHYLGAGELQAAALHAHHAADNAAAALAFDRAARLYRMSLEVWQEDRASSSTLRAKLGEALANAGRGADAARAYLGAADDALGGEALELRRRAAEQFLISGHMEEGLETIQVVLGSVGMRLAPTPRRALAGLLACRARLALGGLRFRPRPAEQAPSDVLARADACWSVGVGLGMVDPIRSAHFLANSLLLALRAGEPSRVARALLMELGFSSTGGGRARRRTEALRDRCRSLVEASGDPYLHGLLAVQEGIVTSMAGEFPRSFEASARGEAILRERCTGVTWELDTAILYQLHALANTGRWRELGERLAPLRDDARERGDLYLTTYILSRTAYLPMLAADEAERARDEQAHSLDGWPQRGFQVQHYWDVFARSEIDLYAGRARDAWQRVSGAWRAFRLSLLTRVQAVWVEAVFLRARAAVAVAASAPAGEARRLLAAAEHDAKRLAAERMPWADPMAALVRSAAAAARGNREGALAFAATAQSGFEAVEMLQLAAAARWRRGQLSGGDGGSALVENARAWLDGHGVQRPDRMVEMLAPGRWT